MSGIAFGADLRLGRAAAGGAAVAGPAFDFTAAMLPAGATLTRASTGMRWNAAGLLVAEAANIPRFDHDPATLAPRGLLIEPAATNFAVRSSDFRFSPWGITGGTVSGDSAVAPDGSGGGDTVTLSAINVTSPATYQRLSQTIGSAGASQPRVFSVWLKGADGGEQIGIEYATDGGIAYGFDGASRLLTLTASWQRYVLLGTRGGTSCYPILGADYDAIGAFAADARFIHVWGAQFENGPRATSHIPTGTGIAARSADVLTLDWGASGVADGAITVRYTFDDLSTQNVAATVAGGVATVPVDLARPHIRRAQKV